MSRCRQGLKADSAVWNAASWAARGYSPDISILPLRVSFVDGLSRHLDEFRADDTTSVVSATGLSRGEWGLLVRRSDVAALLVAMGALARRDAA